MNAMKETHIMKNKCMAESYRTASWWLNWNDMIWPDADVADKFKRRADMAAAAGVNMAVIYGAHFRWDFMPLWMNLHDMIHFIADELHQRGILLFDHHSAVVTHCYSNIEEAKTMRLRNRHHLPFAPSRDIGAEWTYKGKKLDDWLMIDIVTGKPVSLPVYTAKEFCINNPDFRQAYQDYVRRLLAETGIDGLESDDGIFYSNWTSCGCEHCRRKFMKEYGHAVPDISDTSFWGNYKSEAFKDWIEMRFASTREFLEGVRSVVGDGFPLMSCCSDSVGSFLPGYGMTYQEFIKPCDHIMLEMCGNSPSMDGTWQANIPKQMLHLGMSAEHNAPCIGLGYGFSTATADFIWAFNKFLGSGTWLSSIKGRLGLRDSQMTVLKDDTELPSKGFNAEKLNQRIFDAGPDADVAVFFSRWSRDFYSMGPMDYTDDYAKTCQELLDANITFQVVTSVPDAAKFKVLCVSGASCLDDAECAALDKYLSAGGTVLACGPCGCYDKRGNIPAKPWLAQFGIVCEVEEPERIATFPPNAKQPKTAAVCKGSFQGKALAQGEWACVKAGKGMLLWAPGRMQSASKELALAERVNGMLERKFIFPEEAGWRFRVFKREGKSIVHALADRFDVGCMEDLEKLRINRSGNTLIDRVSRRKDIASELSLRFGVDFKSAELFAPLTGAKETLKIEGRSLDIKLDGDVYYFILSFT